MSISDNDLDAIDTTAAKTAARGAKSLTIGDRKIDFLSVGDLIDAKRRLAEEDNGGIYDTEFSPKNSF